MNLFDMYPPKSRILLTISGTIYFYKLILPVRP
jgi:hypothetical protein